MDLDRTTRRHQAPSWWLPVAAGGAALAVVAVVWVAAGMSDGDVGLMVRDPSTTFGAPWRTGAAAMLNATLWGVAAALGAFVASMHRRHRAGLLLFTVLSAALMVEDTLQVKDLGERIGVGEELFLAAYGVAGLAVAWLLRPPRTGAAGRVLLVAGVLLASSIVADLLRGEDHPDLILLEFTPMFVGTALWACVPVLLHQHLARGGRAHQQPARADRAAGAVQPD